MSIYEDRLIPAIDIVYLSEDLYSKRLIAETYLASAEQQANQTLVQQLRTHNERIDSLVMAFEKTYLIERETKRLAEFKELIRQYQSVENRVMVMEKESAKALYQQEGIPLFLQAKESLITLTHIQSEVGKELFREAHAEVSQFTVISLLLVVIALVLGSIVIGLIKSSAIVNTPKQKSPFHLN